MVYCQDFSISLSIVLKHFKELCKIFTEVSTYDCLFADKNIISMALNHKIEIGVFSPFSKIFWISFDIFPYFLCEGKIS